jgi:hypothetical protein
MASAGIDVNHDGRANYVVTGVDMNRDGIPDVLQQARPTTVAMTAAPTVFETVQMAPTTMVAAATTQERYPAHLQEQVREIGRYAGESHIVGKKSD